MPNVVHYGGFAVQTWTINISEDEIGYILWYSAEVDNYPSPSIFTFSNIFIFHRSFKIRGSLISLHLFSMWFLNQNLFHRLCQISLLLSLPHRIQISPSDPLGRNNFSAFPKPFLPPRSTLDQCPPSSLPWQLLPSSLFLLWPLTTQWHVIIIVFIGSVVDKALSCDFCKLLRWVRRLFLSPQREQKLSQGHIANGNTGLSNPGPGSQ